MRILNKSLFLITALACPIPLLAAAELRALSQLPEYQAPIPYAGERNWHVTQNLGPTGARGWVYGHTNHTRDSREILIKSVEPGSPADGLLQPYDIIVGAAVPPSKPSPPVEAPAVKLFDSDARMSLALAITWAEGTEAAGRLPLLRHRDGKVEQIVLQLREMGDYSERAPFDCVKSSRIVDDAVAYLAERMPTEGFAAGVTEPIAAALLLASGDPDHLDAVRRSAVRMSVNHTISDAGHETWRWGNTNLFLAEYYLATGDPRVLPTIEGYCRVLAEGQCNPGTWGHRAVPDFIPPGYGSLNASGVVCFLSMILGRQTGVEIDETAIAKSVLFYGSYAGRGGIPYGDHPPAMNASSNGKNGMAAVAFGQLDAAYPTQWFARLSASSNLAAFEGGHTGNYFNQFWAPLGAYLAGEQSYINFWKRFNSYRDLARRWDGSFMTQPLPNTREGDLGMGNYVRKGPMWSTGAFALSYLAGTDRLAILGRTDSVFAYDAPAELSGALKLFHAKQFEAAKSTAESIAKLSSTERVRKLAAQLAEASGNNLHSLDSTLASMREALAARDIYQLKWQLLGIESILEADDPRLSGFRAAVEDPANARLLTQGAKFDDAVSGAKWSGLHGFQIIASAAQTDRRISDFLQTLAADEDSPYKERAQAHLDAFPPIRLSANKLLIPPADARGMQDGKVLSWRYLLPAEELPENWKQHSFDDTYWQAVALPSSSIGGKGTSHVRGIFEIEDPAAVEDLYIEFTSAEPVRIYLNGTLVFEYPGGINWHKVTKIPLKRAALNLLRKGENCLAAESSIQVRSGFYLSLQAGLRE